MKQKFVKFASVILDVSIDKTLDYGITNEQLSQAFRGARVEVPVKGFSRSGYIFAIKDSADYSPVKGINKILSDGELINNDLFELGLWMAKYYCAPLRQVFKILLPASVRKETKHKEQFFVRRNQSLEQIKEHCIGLRQKFPAQAEVLDQMLKVSKGILLSELLEKTHGSKSPVDTLVKKGLLILDVVRIDRSPLINEEYFQTKRKTLNTEQAIALDKINASLQQNRFETHLLFGITGSGKTEVYLQAIDQALKLGKGTIMLVPEISLTAQTIERFRSRFEGKIAILHHRLSQGERFDEWHKIRRGEAQIVIGARSAIFSPIQNLGLIIVDEEHETSYKQSEEAPCYHARDIAVMRSSMKNGTVILGSATPSLESYFNAQNGKYTLSKLSTRAEAANLPVVRIIDMKPEFDKAKGFTSFSDALLTGIKKRISTGEQTILFLNRRGYHTTFFCNHCQTPVKCNHCDLALTFHLGDNRLSCHLCGFTVSPPPKICPNCKNDQPMKFKGVGTEQIEKALYAIFPGIRILRIDADTTKHKGSHQKLLRDFGTGKADVLIGTQMIAKGLHFPEVTLVGVLNSDSSLNIPDFRSSETVFQLITQVAGRAGRGILPGEVIIQTFLPENETIKLAAEQNYEGFYQQEIDVRKIFNYPPFVAMAKINFSGLHQEITYQFADSIRHFLIKQLPSSYECNPVIVAGYAKVKDHFRYQFLIRGPSIYPVSRIMETLLKTIKFPSNVKMHIDINPSSTFF